MRSIGSVYTATGDSSDPVAAESAVEGIAGGNGGSTVCFGFAVSTDSSVVRG